MFEVRSHIIELVRGMPSLSSLEIHEQLRDRLKREIGYATVKRILQDLISANWLSTTGRGKGTRYVLSPSYELLVPIDVEAYFTKEQFVFTTKSRGFFISGREVFETSDGGATWTRSCKMGKEHFQSITKQGNNVYVLSLGNEIRTTPINGGGSQTSDWTFATILKYQ